MNSTSPSTGGFLMKFYKSKPRKGDLFYYKMMPQCDLRKVTFENFGSTSPPTRVFWWKNTKSKREGRLKMQIYTCDLSKENQWRFTVIATKFQIKYYCSQIFTKCFIYIPPESEKSASYTLFSAIWRLRRNALKCQLYF